MHVCSKTLLQRCAISQAIHTSRLSLHASKTTHASCTLRIRTRGAQTRGTRRSVVISALAPQTLFNVVTLAVMPLYALMTIFPQKQLTKAVVTSPLLYAAGGLLYLTALVTWSREGLLSSLGAACQQYFADYQVAHIAALFESPKLTALSWTHLLLLDLCVARHVYLDGVKRHVITAHSVVLCFMFGPTGLLSHMLTKQLSYKQGTAHLSSMLV